MEKESINIKIDVSEAIRYMGYRSRPESRDMKLIFELRDELEKELKPAWIYRIFGISDEPEGLRVAGTSLVLSGKDIRGHLEGCDRCAIMCVTVSSKADELIRRREAQGILPGFMADCLASAAVEAACGEVEKLLFGRLEDKFFTWRFSPGYGDLPLEIQPTILDILDAPKRVGVTCSDTMLMIPRKSVTAIIGISDKPIEKKRQGCETCSMSGRCSFRKGGSHCGL